MPCIAERKASELFLTAGQLMSALQVRETTACLPLSTHLSMTRFTRISAGLEQPPNQLELKENFEKKNKKPYDRSNSL